MVHPRGFQLGGMKLKGLHSRGEHLEGSEESSPQGAHLRESPGYACSPRSTPEGSGAAQLWPKQRYHAGYWPGCHGWKGKTKCLWVRAAPEEQLQDICEFRAQPCPKALRTALGSYETAGVCPG